MALRCQRAVLKATAFREPRRAKAKKVRSPTGNVLGDASKT